MIRSDWRRWHGLAGLICLSLVISGAALAAEGAPAPGGVLSGYDQLKAEFDAAMAAGEHVDALLLAEQINELVEPIHAEILYEIAKLQARAGHAEEALQWLQAATGSGMWDFRGAMKEELFAEIRQTHAKRFRTILRGTWARGYIWMLERQERDGFQKPDEVMEALALKQGEVVADIGSGSGYFTERIARAIGPEGRVLARDTSSEMLDFLAVRMEDQGLENVELQKVPSDDPMLAPGSVDTILMVDVYHYIKDRAGYARTLAPALKPGGRLVIIDYTPKPLEERPWGPPPQQQFPREVLDADLAEAGFRPVKDHLFLPEQYFVEYRLVE